MNEQFKAGDEVYCPYLGRKVYKLDNFGVRAYPLTIEKKVSFTSYGKISVNHLKPDLFHATLENKALLEALYKCEFEAPKLKGSDLTRKLLNEGNHVLCGLSVHGDGAAGNGTFVGLIVRFEDGCFIDGSNNPWSSAVPCNDYANLVDGVLTLKSEQ